MAKGSTEWAKKVIEGFAAGLQKDGMQEEIIKAFPDINKAFDLSSEMKETQRAEFLVNVMDKIASGIQNITMALEDVDKKRNALKDLEAIYKTIDSGKAVDPTELISFGTKTNQMGAMLSVATTKETKDKLAILDGVRTELRSDLTESFATAIRTSPEMFDAMGVVAGNEGSIIEAATMLADLYCNTFSAEVENSFGTWLSEAMTKATAEAAEQLADSGGLEGFTDNLLNIFKEGGIEEVEKYMNSLDKKSIDFQLGEQLKRDFPEILTGMKEMGTYADDASGKINKLNNSVESVKLRKYKGTVGDLTDEIKGLSKGGATGAKAFEDVRKKVEGNIKAQTALKQVSANMNEVMGDSSKHSEATADALKTISDETGITVKSFGDLKRAQAITNEGADGLSAGLEAIVNQMLAAGSITIDPSGNVSALSTIGGGASDAAVQVADFVNWLISIMGASVSVGTTTDGKGNGTAKVNVNLKGANDKTKKSTKRSGGGGGGGGEQKEEKEDSPTKKLIDNYKHAEGVEDLLRSLVKLRQEYHEGKGELTAVNTLREQEMSLIREQEVENKKRLATVEEMLRQGGHTKEDLEALQSAHSDYSKKVEENRNALEDLSRQITETRKRIREMQIELRTTIEKAIQDRENLKKSMLDGRVSLEQEILDTIRKRYEDEWDLMQKDADKKREAYNKEIRLLQERLDARKKAAKEDEKYRELAKLEAHLGFISSDPTRLKEQEEIRIKLNKLREELAWDIADKEVETQKKSIEDQIKNLDDYMKRMQEYYDNLFKYPQKLIDEMQAVMQKANASMIEWLTANYTGFTQMTAAQQEEVVNKMYQMTHSTTENLMAWLSANVVGFSSMTIDQQNRLAESVRAIAETANTEIIGWLQANNEDFKNSTDANKAQMQASWEETLMQMYGATKVHWDEVEAIIAQGDDAIINFLKENSQEYKNAGHLQAQAYVDAWREQLRNLEAALRNTQQMALDAARAAQAPQATVAAPSSGTTGGSPGGGTTKAKEWYQVLDGKKIGVAYASEADAKAALDRTITLARNSYNSAKTAYDATSSDKHASVSDKKAAEAKMKQFNDTYQATLRASVQAFRHGGYVNYTGLAMVHGSPNKPEAFLSAEDTELMRRFLDSGRSLFKPTIPNIDTSKFSIPQNMVSFNGDIVVQVNELAENADYEVMANKVMHQLKKQMTVKSGASIGGIFR